MKKVIVFALVFAISQFGYSQVDENYKKHSIGLDLGLQGGNPNFGITYRKFSQDSKYNLRANFNLGETHNYWYNESNHYKFFNTNDTAVPLIGISNNSNGFGNYQKLEIGVEKSFSVWKLNLIWGVEATVGHRRYQTFQNIVEAGIDTVEENGFTYFNYGRSTDIPWESLNELNTVFDYVTGGVNLRLGFKLNISQQFYFTSFLTLASELQLIVKENYYYKSDLYKEHLVVRRGGDTFNFYSSLNVGIHYRF